MQHSDREWGLVSVKADRDDRLIEESKKIKEQSKNVSRHNRNQINNREN